MRTFVTHFLSYSSGVGSCLHFMLCSSYEHIKGSFVELFGAFRRSQVFLTTADVISPRLSEQDTFLRYHKGWDSMRLSPFTSAKELHSCIFLRQHCGENKKKSFKARVNISYRLCAHSCCINTNNISAEWQYSTCTVSCLGAVLLNTAPRGQEGFCHIDWTGFHFTAFNLQSLCCGCLFWQFFGASPSRCWDITAEYVKTWSSHESCCMWGYMHTSESHGYTGGLIHSWRDRYLQESFTSICYWSNSG